MNFLFRDVFLFLLCWKSCDGSGKKLNKCKESELVIYNLKLEARWSKREFPKQYPEWRPPAQWSKLIGITHDEDYNLFRIGELANQDLKIFAETGKIDFKKNQSNVESNIYDEFSSPSIKTGVGKTQVNFFANGNHSMISAAVKIIPSPDWFIGIDAFDLCSEGNWMDMVTIEASPMDAGTDSGFTFTAPNWKTEPQERIYKITSRYPRHPASSFYYPKLKDLPPIAIFKIEKMNLYRRIKITSDKERINDQPVVGFVTNKNIKSETRKDDDVQQQIFRKRKFANQRVKCKMGDWSMWSECSSSCGNGFSIRTRKIIRGNKNRQCSSHLKEEKVCHTESDCFKNYFKW